MDLMHGKSAGASLLVMALASCSDSTPFRPPSSATQIVPVDGSGQTAVAGSALPNPLRVLVTDAGDDPVPGVTVTWSVVDGGGSVTASTATDELGIASAEVTLGTCIGEQHIQAEIPDLLGSPVVFTASATADPSAEGLKVVGGGCNVPDRFSSDLWVHGNYAYTGTWGSREGNIGNALNTWFLDASGAPALVSSVTVPGTGTVSDVQVSDDGQLLVVSGERGTNGGIFLYGLSDPANPSLLSSALAGPAGVHTVSLARIDERLYGFAARNTSVNPDPSEDPALLIYDLTDPLAPLLVARQVIPRNYGIHDTFVREGIAFVFAWDTGVIIYDVGNGLAGGSPAAPAEISRLITNENGVPGGPAVHNGWWFHNSVTGERRYLFIGQEGPSVTGTESSGDIHVVDVSDLSNPTEVAFFHMNGAGTHNFWMDEERQILYAAYYNGGVIALDVSGTLTGNLSNRLLWQSRPGGAGNTFTWGVQLANGFLYAIDMLTGLWQLTTE